MTGQDPQHPGEGAWSPPGGSPPAGQPFNLPPPGGGQQGPYGQPQGAPYGQPAAPPPGYGPQPGYGQPGYEQPGYSQPQGPQPGWGGPQGHAAPPPGYGGNGAAGNGYGQPGGFPTGPQPLVTTGTAKKRKGPRIAAAAIAATCLVGSGVFAYASLSGGDGGAESPEAATQAFFDALGKEDVIGMLNTLPKGERRTMVPLLNDLVGEMSRLGVLSDDADPSKIAGVDFEFRDLAFEVDEVAPDLAAVTLTGGTVNGSYDLAELPLGQALIDNAFGGEAPTGTDTTEEDVARADAPELVTVKDDDGWHVSLWYSAAESARKDAGLPVPTLGQGVEAKGADSPEAAVEALFGAISDLDLRRMIELTPPDEMAALHDYAPLFLEDAEASVDELLSSTDFELDVRPTAMEVRDADGRKVVRVSGIEGSATADGETVEFQAQDGCGSITVGGETQEGCLEDLQEAAAEAGEFGDLAGRLANPSLGIATIEVDGQWYVSPTFTFGGVLLDLLAAVEPGDIESLFSAAEEGMSGGFDITPSLNSDIFGSLGGPGSGTSGSEEDDPFEDDEPTASTIPSGSTSTTALDGYDAYYEECGDLEYGVIAATTAAEWKGSLDAASACAAPYLQSGEITREDVYEEVAFPQCYPQWPYDPSLTLAQQSDLFTQIDACVTSNGG